MRKCMDILSVFFSFLESALKRRTTVTEAQIMAQLKKHLAVDGGDRTMIEK